MPAKVKVRILAGRNLPVMDKSSDASDAFVEVKLANTTYKTEVYRRSLNPFWNSEWFRFEVSDQELQDEPLQVRIMDYDTYSANDAIGKVYINLNPLLVTPSKSMSGWLPIYDTLHGIRGEINCMVKVNIFPDNNRFRQSSCGVRFFFSDIPNGYKCEAILGFVDELLVNDDPEYQWIDKIRTPRASNEARQTLFTKLSGEVQRKLGLKAEILGGNAVIGYQQSFDLEGGSGIVGRGIGTAVVLSHIGSTEDELIAQYNNDMHQLHHQGTRSTTRANNNDGHQSKSIIISSHGIHPTPKHLKHSISSDYFYEVPTLAKLQSKVPNSNLSSSLTFNNLDLTSQNEYHSLSTNSTLSDHQPSYLSLNGDDDLNDSDSTSHELELTPIQINPYLAGAKNTKLLSNILKKGYSMRPPKLVSALKDNNFKKNISRKLSASEIFLKFRQNSSDSLTQRLANINFRPISGSNILTKLLSQSTNQPKATQQSISNTSATGVGGTTTNAPPALSSKLFQDRKTSAKSSSRTSDSDKLASFDGSNNNNPSTSEDSSSQSVPMSQNESQQPPASPKRKRAVSQTASIEDALSTIEEKLDDEDNISATNQQQQTNRSKGQMERTKNIDLADDDFSHHDHHQTKPKDRKSPLYRDHSIHDISEATMSTSNASSVETIKAIDDHKSNTTTTTKQTTPPAHTKSMDLTPSRNPNVSLARSESVQTKSYHENPVGSLSSQPTTKSTASTNNNNHHTTSNQFVKSVGVIKAQQHLLQNIIKVNNQSLIPSHAQNKIKSVFIYPICNDHQSEYPFVTFKKFPQNMIRSIGGVVSVHSVKLLDHIINDEESETRDVWWTEIRKEIGCHAKALNCNTIIGYTETSKVLNDVCILSASGTAAILSNNCHDDNNHQRKNDHYRDNSTSFHGHRARSSSANLRLPNHGNSPPPSHSSMPHHNGNNNSELDNNNISKSNVITTQESFIESSSKDICDNVIPQRRDNNSERDCRSTAPLPFSSSPPETETEADGYSKVGAGTASFLDCSLCHTPLVCSDSVNLLSKCSVCNQSKVPDVLLLTIEPPQNLNIVSKGILIQARVCRAKRDTHGEVSAKEIGEALPFLEYELHRQLFSKLKFKGLNCLFNLTVDISMGENMISGLATATGCFVLGLPEPEAPRISGGKGIKTSKLLQIQRLIETTSVKNRQSLEIDQIKAQLRAYRELHQPMIRPSSSLSEPVVESAGHTSIQTLGLIQGDIGEREATTSWRGEHNKHNNHQHHHHQSSSGSGSSMAPHRRLHASRISNHAKGTNPTFLHNNNNTLLTSDLSTNKLNNNNLVHKLLNDDNNIVLEVDDTEDANIIALLIDSDVPDGYVVCNSESVPSIDQSSITSINMFTQVMRAKLTGLDQFGHLFDWILQALFVKLRRSLPCCLTNVTYGVDLPESNVVQVTISGCLLALQKNHHYGITSSPKVEHLNLSTRNYVESEPVTEPGAMSSQPPPEHTTSTSATPETSPSSRRSSSSSSPLSSSNNNMTSSSGTEVEDNTKNNEYRVEARSKCPKSRDKLNKTMEPVRSSKAQISTKVTKRLGANESTYHSMELNALKENCDDAKNTKAPEQQPQLKPNQFIRTVFKKQLSYPGAMSPAISGQELPRIPGDSKQSIPTSSSSTGTTAAAAAARRATNLLNKVVKQPFKDMSSSLNNNNNLSSSSNSNSNSNNNNINDRSDNDSTPNSSAKFMQKLVNSKNQSSIDKTTGGLSSAGSSKQITTTSFINDSKESATSCSNQPLKRSQTSPHSKVSLMTGSHTNTSEPVAGNMEQNLGYPNQQTNNNLTHHRRRYSTNVNINSNKAIDISSLSYIPGAKEYHYLGNLSFSFVRETGSVRENGGLNGFIHCFLMEVFAIVRAHVSALGGNALLSLRLQQSCIWYHSNKNQAQCLISVAGDAVQVIF